MSFLALCPHDPYPKRKKRKRTPGLKPKDVHQKSPKSDFGCLKEEPSKVTKVQKGLSTKVGREIRNEKAIRGNQII